MAAIIAFGRNGLVLVNAEVISAVEDFCLAEGHEGVLHCHPAFFNQHECDVVVLDRNVEGGAANGDHRRRRLNAIGVRRAVQFFDVNFDASDPEVEQLTQVTLVAAKGSAGVGEDLEDAAIRHLDFCVSINASDNFLFRIDRIADVDGPRSFILENLNLALRVQHPPGRSRCNRHQLRRRHGNTGEAENRREDTGLDKSTKHYIDSNAITKNTEQFNIRYISCETVEAIFRPINSSAERLPIIRVESVLTMERFMCRIDTQLRVVFATLFLLLVAQEGYAQTYEFPLNWRAIGTTVVYNSRAGLSGGTAAGLWFSSEGDALELQLENGRIFRTSDFLNWTLVPKAGSRVGVAAKVVYRLPEARAKAFSAPGNSYRAYAAGRFLWRSDDTGKHWVNLVAEGETRLIGENVRSISVSPLDSDRVAVLTEEGVWLTVDGGRAWSSLNPGLPNLRLSRLVAAPQAGRGLIAEWENGGLVEWVPGAKAAWVARGPVAAKRDGLRWMDALRPELRLEVRQQGRARVFRSLNGGLQWDDLTSDLEGQEILGLAADRASGAIYVATERGVFYTLNNLELASGPTSWIRLGGNLPREAALDVMLDEGGNFLYASIAGEGVFLTYAPHRRRNPAMISAADLNSRGAAPGGLMSVLGMKLTQVQLAGKALPILSATSDETQVQIPYDAVIPSPALELSAGSGNVRMDLELSETAPVIFTDRDGAPLMLDAESGDLIDPAVALRPGMRIQILLTGLGKVEPAWPAGVAAPSQNSPRVMAPVRVWFAGQTLEVLKAELAGGYVGFYAVEAKLPPVLDDALQPLQVEAGGKFSNTILIRTAFNSP